MNKKDLWNNRYDACYGVCDGCYQIKKGVMEVIIHFTHFHFCYDCWIKGDSNE